MVYIYHIKNSVKAIEHNGKDIVASSSPISQQLFELADQFHDEWIIWCEHSLKELIDINAVTSIFHHKKIMASYGTESYLPSSIGFVENSPYININRKVVYPTWQMHTAVGGIHTSILLALKEEIKPDKDFGYFLNSIAKSAMPLGLQCYFVPNLLKEPSKVPEEPSALNSTLFRFVKQHYKPIWVYLLFLNSSIYKKKFPLIALCYSLFYKRRKVSEGIMNKIPFQSSKTIAKNGSVDVIIPTLGRKKYLYDFLIDLSNQTCLPKNTIIVEQNPEENGTSELDYINDQSWPFKIKHIFIKQTGACNARNVALEEVESEWVFFADDDIRIEKDFIQKAFIKVSEIGAGAVSLSCLQQGERQVYNTIFQWVSFGSGCSIVLTDYLKNCRFNIKYEFGFGEDSDFGMQLRNNGHDILYLPEPRILHIKAPIGGFRSKPKQLWENEKIQPKPSPTVMLFQLSYHTKEQLRGYKTVLFIKFYNHQSIKNPFKYYRVFKQRWNRSVFWARKLKYDKS